MNSPHAWSWAAALGLTMLASLMAPTGCSGSSTSTGPEGDGDGSNSGAGCSADDDCPAATPICDGTEGCVSCQLDAHCDPGERCVDYSCEPAFSCEDSADCADIRLPVCETSTGLCQECVDHSDCPTDARCNEERTCTPVDNCSSTTDCKNDQVCDRNRGFCVDCVGDRDCGEDKVCSDFECITACTENADCGDDGGLCDTTFGHCVDCLLDADCEGNYFCDAGECELDACTPESTTCDDDYNAVDKCLASGEGHTRLLCPSGTTCNEGKRGASCDPWVCNPGETVCDAEQNVLQTCDSSGLNLSAEVDCRDMDGRCEAESCQDVVCEAGENLCVNGDSYLCNNLGTAFSLASSCLSGQYCDEPTGLCENKVCTPSTTSCDEESVRTCNSTGSGYLVATTDCAAGGDVCITGACEPVICDFTTRCNGNTVETCTAKGSAIVGSTCPSNQHCTESEGPQAMCVLDVCNQGTSSCSGDTATTCNADGSGYLAQVDCSQQSLDCITPGGCAAVAGTGTSSYDYSYDNYVFVNHYKADSTVTLANFEVYMNTYTSTSLNFVVYESDTQFGDYTIIAQASESAYSTSTFWHDSPALNVTLTADKFYMIGVHVYNTDYNYYGNIGATRTTGPLEELGRTRVSDPAPLLSPRAIASFTDTTSSYQQRLYFE